MKLMPVLVPLIKVLVFDFVLTCDDIDYSEVITVIDRNILLTVVFLMDEVGLALTHEEDVIDIISFFVDEIIVVEELGS